MRYWLMKSEPDVFSIDDLKQRGNKGEPWDGVRNYQARNFMRDGMQVGDLALFYHSNCAEPGVVGLMKISQSAEPDLTALDKDSEYHDPKATKENPRWCRVTVAFVEKFRTPVTLVGMKQEPVLEQMQVLQRGNRLSITPVSAEEFEHICQLGR